MQKVEVPKVVTRVQRNLLRLGRRPLGGNIMFAHDNAENCRHQIILLLRLTLHVLPGPFGRAASTRTLQTRNHQVTRLQPPLPINFSTAMRTL